MEIKIAKNAGFCFGVKRAMQMASDELDDKSTEVYSLGPLIHNKQAVSKYEEKGLKVVEEIENIPSKERVIIRSHGVGEIVYNEAENKSVKIVEKLNTILKDTVMKNTICSATKERQLSAKNLAKEVDCMIVIGGKHSSNTQKLVNICKDLTNTFAIETKDELNKEELQNYKSIGITAGASTPDWIIAEVIEFLESI